MRKNLLIKFFIIGLLLFSSVIFPVQPSFAQEDAIINEEKTSAIISAGVTHENIKRFMDSGWLNINVIKVDLTNPYIKLDLLHSPDGIGTLANVKTMAESSRAIAAINSDFFNKAVIPGRTNSGSAIGLAMKAGTIISSAYYEKNVFSSFVMDNMKNFFYSYVSNSITLTAPNGSVTRVSAINKIASSYKIPVVYNRYWGKMSVGSSEKYPGLTEVVVDDGIVSEIRTNQPAVEIPENGYVISASQDSAQALINNFQVGDSIKLDITTTPDLTGQDFSVGGDTLLLINGQLAPITHSIAGLHPRSAMGTSADNKTLYLVAVDGRQILSRGVTISEMASIMKEIGCWNAINFDGGGSTTLVARALGTNIINVINEPSESLRKVIEGIGVFTTAPVGTLQNIVIDTKDTNVFLNSTREFSVRGFDQNYNPIDVNPSDVIWRLDGIKGSFSNNTLTAEELGEGTVTAKINGVFARIQINVIKAPTEINIYPRDIVTSVGKTVPVKVTGKNIYGYSSILEPSGLNWKNLDGIGIIDANGFTPTAKGTVIAECSVGGATAYCRISVTGEAENIVQPCEESVASFKSYPTEITGDVSLSSEQVHSGSYSYKFSYDFSATEGSRAAYTVFPNNSIILPASASDIGIWVYNDSPKQDWLKTQIVDAEGLTHLVDLSRDVSWTGWKFIKIPLAEEITLPAQISRVYMVQIDSGIKSTGTLYFDDITVFSTKAGAGTDVIPENIKIPDTSEKEVEFEKSSTCFQFAVTGKLFKPETILDKIYDQKINEGMKKSELLIVSQSSDKEYLKKFNKDLISIPDGMAITTFKNSTFITLDNSKDGLRKTNSKQWKWLKQKLETIDSSNVFILLPKPVNGDSFTDPYEAELFRNLLSKYRKDTTRTVWVISGGKVTDCTVDRGIRNISLAGRPTGAGLDQTLDNSKYLLVTVKDTVVTYQLKNVF